MKVGMILRRFLACCASTILIAACLAVTTRLHAAAPAIPAGPTDADRKALAELASEIEGTVLYTQIEGRSGWFVKRMEIGQWQPQTLGPGRFARWSPDGKKIAVWSDGVNFDNGQPYTQLGSVYVMDADGGNRKKLVSDVMSTDFEWGCPIEFHSNNKEIIYIPKADKNPADPRKPVWHGLWTVDIATGQMRKMDIPGEAYTSEPQITLDGKFLACRCHDFPGTLTLVDLVNKTYKRYGAGGCMASISCDGQWMTNNYGGHNRCTFWNRDGVRRIDISADGMVSDKRWDAVHWSNHPNYFAIRGDARERPVYICRFTEADQRFTRVVFGGGGCEYPDLYVRKDLKSGAKPATIASSVSPTKGAAGSGAPAKPGTPATQTWPANVTGLVFAWANDSASNVIRDASGKVVRGCEVRMHGLAKYGRHYVMDFTTGPGYFTAEEIAGPLLDVCRRSGQLGLEAMITPAETPTAAQGDIITFSGGPTSRNFTLAQKGNQLVLILRTETSGENGTMPVALCTLAPGIATHVAVGYNGGEIVCYVNGKEASRSSAVIGGFSTWKPQTLQFGDEVGGGAPWRGRLEGVALYSRPILQAEAALKYKLYAENIAKRPKVEPLVIEARIVQVAPLPKSADIDKDYPRCLVYSLCEVTAVRKGTYADKRIAVLSWGILDAAAIPEIARRKPGDVVTLYLEKYDDNTQLGSEKKAELAGPAAAAAQDLLPYFEVGKP